MNSVNSNINILGGYKKLGSSPDLMTEIDSLSIERTVSSQKRYQKAMKEVFLHFEEEQLKALFMAAMESSVLSDEVKHRAMALQFYSNDNLFHLLFNQCFLPIFKSGRMSINKHDVIAFLDEQIQLSLINVDWSRETIDTVSRKYLTILKKLGFLDGKVKKTIKEPFTSFEFLIFFHFWLNAAGENSNVFKSACFPFLMLSKEKYQFLMKQPEIREKLDWQFTGDKFIVDYKISLGEYIHEL